MQRLRPIKPKAPDELSEGCKKYVRKFTRNARRFDLALWQGKAEGRLRHSSNTGTTSHCTAG